MNDFYTVAEYAKLTGKSRFTVYECIKNRRIKRPDGSLGAIEPTTVTPMGISWLVYKDAKIFYADKEETAKKRNATRAKKKAIQDADGYKVQVKEDNGTWSPWRDGFKSLGEAKSYLAKEQWSQRYIFRIVQ